MMLNRVTEIMLDHVTAIMLNPVTAAKTGIEIFETDTYNTHDRKLTPLHLPIYLYKILI